MRLHHVAYVTRDVEAKASSLARLLGLGESSATTLDSTQQVRIKFVNLGGQVPLELLEPLSESSPVAAFLKRGGGLFHLCFEVDDLDETIRKVQETGEAFVVCQPVQAPAIQGRRVAFVVTADRDLIEFVEPARPKTAEPPIAPAPGPL